MVTLTQLLTFVVSYPHIVSFLGALLGGEETIILLSIIAAQGYIDLWVVAVFCYIGILVSDIFWYYIGKTSLFNWIVKRKWVSPAYMHWDRLLDKTTQGNDFQALLTTKFLYGFRVITIMYLSRERMKLKNFVKYSLIIDFIWIAITITFGWLAGKGVKSIMLFSDNIIISLFIIGLFMLFFFILMKLIERRVKKWLAKK